MLAATLRAAVSPPLVYVDTSEVREGALEELKGAIEELAAFIEANHPRILAYNVYFSDDGSEMSVVHVHADSASLDHHMEIGGPVFKKFADLLTLRSIRVYGEPSERVIRQLHEKARNLGCADVSVHIPQAGFARFAAQ